MAKPPKAASRGGSRAQGPKKVTSVRLDRGVVDWIEKNVPRSTSVSAFLNQAAWEKIERERKAGPIK